MGKKIHIDKVIELFNKSPVVDAKSIRRIVKSKKNIKQYSRHILKNLIKQNKIYSLTKGYYTKHDEISLAVFAFQPSYLGLQDALSQHNLWEQETIPIIITSKNVRTGIRKVMGRNILVRKINKKYLFGYEFKKIGNFNLPYSDIEKTFIDMIYFNEKYDVVLISDIKKKLNKNKLNDYLKKYPLKFRQKVEKVLKEKD